MIYHYNEGGHDALNKIIKSHKPSKIFVLTDQNTQKYCLPFFSKHVNFEFTNVNIKAGDNFKNIQGVTAIWEQLMSAGADRKSLMINLGGGVVTDIGGFAAATFKRGIEFIHVPTSLLGMVDAAIGGKNGINFKGVKNQIGTIIQPEMIWINTFFLDSLPKDEFDSGYAEMLKHGLIADGGYWHKLKKFYFSQDKVDLKKLVKTSVEIKHDIISKDPFEKNIRKLLNFGHTMGHGIESHLNYRKNIKISHGKAVAIGMILEAYLSYKVNGLDFHSLLDIKETINNIYAPVNFDGEDVKAILDLIKYDKKNENGKVLFVLLNSIGRASYNLEVPDAVIKEAFQFYKK